MRRLGLFGAAFAGALATSATAQQPAHADPDWPCVQRKVPTLTPAAIWTGPPVEGAAGWRADAEVAALVDRLRQRRIPLEQAEAEIAAFAEVTPPESRSEQLTRLFAGLFETMNAERSEIIEGIERFARRQREAADDIRNQVAAGGAAPPPEAGPAATTEAQEALQWRIRIYEERRRSLPFICDVPRLVERRLFALGRAIGQAMPE